MVALALVLFRAQLPETPQEIVPPLGHVAGIVIGQTTVQQFETEHGKTYSQAWGLAVGRRHYFYDATSGAEICLDGTFASPKGQVIDDVEITWLGKGKARVERRFDASGKHPAYKASLPVLHLAEGELGELSIFHAGQTRAQVNAETRLRLGKWDMVRSPGHVEYSRNLRYIADGAPWKARGFYLWIAGCSFSHLKLDGLTLSAATLG